MLNRGTLSPYRGLHTTLKTLNEPASSTQISADFLMLWRIVLCSCCTLMLRHVALNCCAMSFQQPVWYSMMMDGADGEVDGKK